MIIYMVIQRVCVAVIRIIISHIIYYLYIILINWMAKEHILSIIKTGQKHKTKLRLVVISSARFCAREQNDSNAVLPLPEGRLEDICLSLLHHAVGVTGRCPPTCPQTLNMNMTFCFCYLFCFSCLFFFFKRRQHYMLLYYHYVVV